MRTQLLEEKDYQIARHFLLSDELVVVPTETVYGLAANAESDIACKKIYQVKQRPQDNPLIVHCADMDMIRTCMNSDLLHSCQIAIKILEAFAPSPITVVVPSSNRICSSARAGGHTVALRIPQHELCRKIIKEVGVPLAAPSANISGYPSATDALMAWDALYGKVSAIVDGGVCVYGLESTIVDCTGLRPIIVREGCIGSEEISKKIGVEIVSMLEQRAGKSTSQNTGLNSTLKMRTEDLNMQSLTPGSKYKHYAPDCKVHAVLRKDVETLFASSEYDQNRIAHAFETLWENYGNEGEYQLQNIGMVLIDWDGRQQVIQTNFGMFKIYENWAALATELYAIFAEADRRKLCNLFITLPAEYEHPALYDRLTRASQSEHNTAK